MTSPTATVDVGSVAAVIQSALATTHTLASPFSPNNFPASPEDHCLPRTGLKGDKTRFLAAAMDALACRLQKLSLSEQPAGQPTAPARDDSVYIDTAVPVTVKGLVRRKLFNYNTKVLAKCTQSIKATLKRTAGKRSDKTKKAGGASRPLSQCSSEADPLVGQIVRSMGGPSELEALEANRHHQVSQFHEMFSFEVREPIARGVVDHTFPSTTYFGVPLSNALPAVATIRDGTAHVPMDEVVYQAPSPPPTSPAPMPMELEAGIPSNNVASVAESSRTPFDPSMDSALGASVPEAMDTIMSDGDDVSREMELTRHQESASKTPIDCAFTERVSSTPADQEVEMKDANDSRSFTSIQQASIRLIRPIGATSTSDGLDGISNTDTSQSPARTPTPGASAGAATLEGGPARSLSLDTTPESQSPTEVAQDKETYMTQHQVAPIQSRGLVSPSPNTATSINLQPVAPPSPTAASSTAGPSTPTLSAQRSLTPDEVQPPKTHAARLHQTLGKWVFLKRASKSPQLPVCNEISEEAELNAFLRFAQHKAPRPSIKSQSKPTSPRGSSEQKQTKGGAARSLMDDIMAGFRGVPNQKSSGQQVAAAVQPPAQSRSTLRTSSAIPPRDQHPTSVVAGRQPGPQSTPPRHVGTGCEVVASRGSVISSRAPSTISTTGKANGPPVGNPVQVRLPSEAAPPGTTLGSSDAAMDGVEPGRMVKGSRRVARAIAKTGWTWEAVQQKAREAQAALELESGIEEALAPASSLKVSEERLKSSAWHAAQPPPPPEAIPYINVERKFRRGTRQEASS
ncbi:hypothetical protein M407DRAFT_19571 [Tulasnella calospora MUT 4182]|uniref:Uncharacterized protein n=1 Tax=Tulasnella calospora MUT 4182 TaxID=1051891 RepID=A0A0C3QTD4_9AGAM|nr:hypothetical protein M407DRAFT_19571 [Tulasnella calospora MUT 4182]